jgi:hypothetical protein
MSGTCIWHLDDYDDDDSYETSCGKSFVLLDGTLKENEIIFCCYCGKKIEETFSSDEAKDDE